MAEKLQIDGSIVCDAGGQLSKRGELLGLYQPVLRSPQLIQRFCQFACAGPDAFKQAHVLNGNRRLVGERCYQFDLLVAERPHLVTRSVAAMTRPDHACAPAPRRTGGHSRSR